MSDGAQPVNNGESEENPYSSKRRSSLNASITDDDDIRMEWDQLSLQEELMRQELLDAIENMELFHVGLENSSTEKPPKDEPVEGIIKPVMLQEDDDVQVQEDFVPSRKEEESQPWYAKLLQRKPTLEQEIKRRKEILRQELASMDDGLQDVMDAQTDMQSRLVVRSRFQGAVRRIQMGNLIQQSLEQSAQEQQQIQRSLEDAIAQKNSTIGTDTPKSKYMVQL